MHKKYPSIMRSWDRNWAELSTFFEYPQEIRKLIYTTDSIRKVVYLSAKEIQKKWTMPVRDWGLVYSQIMIYFEDRLTA